MGSEHENPYSPPRSEVVDSGSRASRRLWWKAYFWLLLLGVASLLVLRVTGQWAAQPLDAVDLAFSTVSYTGLYGFVYGRGIGRRRFWAGWLSFALVWDSAVTFYFVPNGLAYAIVGAEPTTLGEAVFTIAFTLPLFWALYLYALRSPGLWISRKKAEL